jgi:hypothetical protein
MGKFIGELTLESIKEYVNDITKLANAHNCKRLINDLREANIKLSMADFFNAPRIASDKVFDRTWKRAIIVKKKTDKLSFFETTSLNQGFQVKVFLTIEDALKWL